MIKKTSVKIKMGVFCNVPGIIYTNPSLLLPGMNL